MQIIEIPEQTPSSELDQEILEIFVEEVGEILENIITHFKAFQNEPANSESLKELRRCFHTLKGSGRLVGATVIGELGWCFENMLNKVIDGTLSRNNDMLSLIEQVEKVLPSMLAQFQDNQPPPDDVVLLISQADYLTHHSDSHQPPRESVPEPPDKDEQVREPLKSPNLEQPPPE
jgi:chemosensory pili system protein ChpA (sensor histidine kinase/response regulator)